jgi:undecaprenyl-diphosphatase
MLFWAGLFQEIDIRKGAWLLSLSLIVFFQAVLESLPVSSSGHVALFEKFLMSLGGLKSQLGISCYKYLELALHLPSALIFAFFLMFELRHCWLLVGTSRHFFFVFIFLADLITAVIYLFVPRVGFIPLWVGFLITGLMILISSTVSWQEDNNLSIKKSLFMGFLQAVSLQPGISRLALTYLTGRVVGFSKECSLFVSLSLAIPLFIGGGLKGLYGILTHKACYNSIFSIYFLALIFLASLLAFLLLVCLKWLIKHDKYWILSVYLVVPAMLAFFFGQGS